MKKAKSEVSQEYMQSTADLLVLRGRPHFGVVNTFLVSDVTRAGLREVDYGWRMAVYAGVATGDVVAIPGLPGFYVAARNGIVVPICLPGPAMERIVAELETMISEPTNIIKSAL